MLFTSHKKIPIKAAQYLLDDAVQRDRTTARRVLLFELLWRERYLTRKHLIDKVRARLGANSFGEKAWEDTFYRDMRAVKRAFRRDGFRLIYSRRADRPGYYLEGEPALHMDVAKEIAGSLREIDRNQIAIVKSMTAKERMSQAISLSDTVKLIARQNVKQSSQIE